MNGFENGISKLAVLKKFGTHSVSIVSCRFVMITIIFLVAAIHMYVIRVFFFYPHYDQAYISS